jgi:hypothetical protein
MSSNPGFSSGFAFGGFTVGQSSCTATVSVSVVTTITITVIAKIAGASDG